MLNTQRLGGFVLNIGAFCGKKAYIICGSCYIIITSAIVFFEKSFRVPKIVPKVSSVLRGLKECDGTHSERSARRVPTLRNQRKHRTN